MNAKTEDKNLSPTAEEIPQIFTVILESNKKKFSRRSFIEAAAITSGAVALTSCQPSKESPSATLIPRVTITKTPTKISPTKTKTKTSTPTRTYTPTPYSITGSSKTQGINLRTGPGTNYQIIGSLAINVPINVIGQLNDGSWFKVRINIDFLPTLKNRSIEEVEGWIRQDLVNLDGQLPDNLPVEVAPPTPTPLPNTPIPPGGEGIQYEYTDQYGNVKTYTLPCGAPIPPGAICTCNCVTVCSCVGYVAPTFEPSCSCDSQGDTICTCDSVCSCDLVTYWYPN